MKCFILRYLMGLHKILMKPLEQLYPIPFLDPRNWASKHLSDRAKVTELVNGKGGSQTEGFELEILCSFHGIMQGS